MTKKQATDLFDALDELGNTAEFLTSNDFDVALRWLEEARVRIRRVATQLTEDLPNRPIGP